MYAGLYETGKRFSLAGLYAGRNGLGDDGSGIDVNELISEGLTDVTQLLSPGTPSPRPVYTPVTTAIGASTSAFSLSNPAVLLGLGVAAALLLKRR